MSTMYPKYSKKTEGDTVIMEQKLLKKVSHLRLNTTKCSGCGVCSEVCPKEAIILGLVGAVLRGAVKGGSPISVNPAECSYCGVCTIMCPFGALELEVDGEPSLPIREQNGFPQYSITAEIDNSKCICCTTCSDVCPQNAIIRDVPIYEGDSPDGEKRQNALDTEISFEVDTDKCTVCGICATLCPALHIERIPFSACDPISAGEVVWDNILCNACRVCSDACPHNAITVRRLPAPGGNKLPGNVTINQDLCITCTWCEQVCPTEAVTIKKFFEGEIIFNADKCPGGCSTCVDICPCSAIYLPTPIPAMFLKRDSIEPNIAVNKDLCILCGACVNSCPSEDAIIIKRSGIHIKGPETDLYKSVADRLFVPRTSRLKEDTFGQVELKPLE
ncbi:4Fe-4S binding protein [Methanocorpusculum sp. MG]|uniref:4Fe-4S binding protein n=2 Tax=Methanocorpusculum petauri TaxID=3002863 RepID=A0ABT4IJI1_9EURY|nr:4Fe-4S binding protein [Methanocorpusculum petauri]MCZ0861544.1 4Fe-4S binding protein [Methanocorpusculum petauri]